MDDCLILGGGVIGLSLAYELAGHGLGVRVLDRSAPGGESSWAGAGILTPGRLLPGASAGEQLVGLSNQLHAEWATRLRDETGIDNGFRRCGGVYLAAESATEGELRELARHWRAQDVAVEELDAAALVQLEPGLGGSSLLAGLRLALHTPEEAQLRNPRHVKGLIAACQRRGVKISSGVEAEDFVVERQRVVGVRTAEGVLSAETYCIASGAWSRKLLSRLGATAALKPIRGQIVLLACDQPVLTRIINDERRYLVPRPDGRVLIGSTEEDVGFDKQTTASGVAELLDFGLRLAPALSGARLERSWAGLRPGTERGWPYLGKVPNWDNAYVAAGHFRSGLHLSTGTAVVMSQLIRGERPQIDLASFELKSS